MWQNIFKNVIKFKSFQQSLENEKIVHISVIFKVNKRISFSERSFLLNKKFPSSHTHKKGLKLNYILDKFVYLILKYDSLTFIEIRNGWVFKMC